MSRILECAILTDFDTCSRFAIDNIKCIRDSMLCLEATSVYIALLGTQNDIKPLIIPSKKYQEC